MRRIDKNNSNNEEQKYKDWYKRWKQLPPDKQKEEIRKLSPQQRQKLKAYLQKKGVNLDKLENESNTTTTPQSNMTPLEKWRQMPKAKRQELYSQVPNDMKAQLDSWMSMTLADRKNAWQNLSEAEKKKWRKAFARF